MRLLLKIENMVGQELITPVSYAFDPCKCLAQI